MYTTATGFLEALAEQGMDYIFANLGSDHPGLLEALAEARVNGRKVPRLITCPNEMVALSMAHGYAQISGRAQAVLVHVECGTQALAGAVHNATKARIPVMIFAGSSPFTQEGELLGSRNEFIQWIQDVHDQRGLVRGYMRYDAEIRTGANIKQMVHRAMQFAYSDPKGPVYLMVAREVLEAPCTPVEINMEHWRPVAHQPLDQADAQMLVEALANARRPLLVTSYLGRNPEAVAELTAFCSRLGVGVLESIPSYMNFPHDNPLYQGNHWNHPFQNEALAEADVILVIDSDVPWIPTVSKPAATAKLYHIDIDPLKQQMPLWYIGALKSFRADAFKALRQLNTCLDSMSLDAPAIKARTSHYAVRNAARRTTLDALELQENGLGVHHIMAALRARDPGNMIVLSEGITNYHVIHDHLAPSRPGSIIASGGGSLGWNGGAALGVKMALPEAMVVAVTGDGSYMFSVPSTVHWISRRYEVPFLQIVLNNGGWNAPRHSALSVHPNGFASRETDLGLSFEPAPAYAGIAAASGGAESIALERREDVGAVLDRAIAILGREKRSVVIDARLS